MHFIFSISWSTNLKIINFYIRVFYLLELSIVSGFKEIGRFFKNSYLKFLLFEGFLMRFPDKLLIQNKRLSVS